MRWKSMTPMYFSIEFVKTILFAENLICDFFSQVKIFSNFHSTTGKRHWYRNRSLSIVRYFAKGWKINIFWNWKGRFKSYMIIILYKLLQEPNDIFFWIIFQVPRLAVTPEIFARTFDLNKDGHLTVAEMAAAVFAEKY